MTTTVLHCPRFSPFAWLLYGLPPTKGSYCWMLPSVRLSVPPARTKKQKLQILKFGTNVPRWIFEEKVKGQGHITLQVHISASVVESQQTATRLAECIERLDRWMGMNGLKLNAEKTQLMWLGSRHQLAKLIVSQLFLVTTTLCSTVDIVLTANDLGVILDGQPTMARHISSVCRAGFSSYVSCGLFANLWRPRRHGP